MDKPHPFSYPCRTSPSHLILTERPLEKSSNLIEPSLIRNPKAMRKVIAPTAVAKLQADESSKAHAEPPPSSPGMSMYPLSAIQPKTMMEHS